MLKENPIQMANETDSQFIKIYEQIEWKYIY